MQLSEYYFNGDRALDLTNQPTGAEAHKKKKNTLMEEFTRNMERAAELQEMLYAEKREGLVLAIQARDAAGKDSLVKHVFSGLNPAALRVSAFKPPNSTELSHDYLWRISQELPPRGTIGIFNRSQYEDVLVARVNHLEKVYCMPERCITPDFYQRRYRQLRDWELYLYENGYRMVKIFLNVSQETERDRFLERMEREDKHWKLSLNDMDVRAKWDDYTAAYQDAINATATDEAPWYVLPADNKWFTRCLVAQILVNTLEEMAPAWPELSEADKLRIPETIKKLKEERL